VRAQLLRGTDAGKASRLRTAMKRLTDAFTWGALEEDDYRAQLSDLRSQIERAEQVPDERRILEATQMALVSPFIPEVEFRPLQAIDPWLTRGVEDWAVLHGLARNRRRRRSTASSRTTTAC